MHTITECPRCKKDFMYHSTDTYLIKQVTIIDEVGNNEIVDITICQECNDVEESIKSKETLAERVDRESYFFDTAEDAAIFHLNIAQAHLFEEFESRDYCSILTSIDELRETIENFKNK